MSFASFLMPEQQSLLRSTCAPTGAQVVQQVNAPSAVDARQNGVALQHEVKPGPQF